MVDVGKTTKFDIIGVFLVANVLKPTFVKLCHCIDKVVSRKIFYLLEGDGVEEFK